MIPARSGYQLAVGSRFCVAHSDFLKSRRAVIQTVRRSWWWKSYVLRQRKTYQFLVDSLVASAATRDVSMSVPLRSNVNIYRRSQVGLITHIWLNAGLNTPYMGYKYHIVAKYYLLKISHV